MRMLVSQSKLGTLLGNCLQMSSFLVRKKGPLDSHLCYCLFLSLGSLPKPALKKGMQCRLLTIEGRGRGNGERNKDAIEKVINNLAAVCFNKKVIDQP